MYNLELTNLKDLVTCSSIYFDPNFNITNIEEDQDLMKQYVEFNELFEDCQENEDNFSKWIIRFELSKEEMLKNLRGNSCFYSLPCGHSR